MAVNISLDTNIDEELSKIKDLIKGLEHVKEKAQLIQFISIKEFADMTGWGERTVQELYNRPDFPSTDYGREKKELMEYYGLTDVYDNCADASAKFTTQRFFTYEREIYSPISLICFTSKKENFPPEASCIIWR